MDIRLKSVAQALITDFENYDVSQRREDEYNSYKVSNGAQKEFVTDRLKQIFPKSHSKMSVSNISISGKILSKISQAYKEKPIRTVKDDVKDALINDIYSEGNFDMSFQDFDKDFNRQRYSLLWVVQDEMEQLKLRSIKGFESGVVRDKVNGDLIAVVLSYPDSTITGGSDGIESVISESQDDTSANTKTYAIWTDDYHVVWRTRDTFNEQQERIFHMEKLTQDTNLNEVNPLGILPFVFTSRDSSFDLPFLNPITNQSIEANVNLSHLLTAAVKQGHGQLVLSLPADLEIDEIHTGLTTAVILPLQEGREQQPDAKYISPSPDLDGMSKVYYDSIQSIASEYGLETQALKNDTSFNSGIERLIAQASVQDVIQSNQQRYALIERKVFDIVKAYLSMVGVNNMNDDRLTVIYPKPKVLISDNEAITNVVSLLSNGLITKADALRKLDPNLDNESANEMLDQINNERNLVTNEVLGIDNADQEN